MNSKTIVVDTQQEVRIDKFLHNNLKDLGFSREFLKGLMKHGNVILNGIKVTKPSLKVNKGDIVEICFPENNPLESVKGRLNILYEDDFLIVLDKPSNLTTHPAPSCKEPTLVNLLLYNYPKLKKLDKERPGIVHRLDKDTSGLMIVALDSRVGDILKKKFKNREIKKTYLALVSGIPFPSEGEIDVFMDRDNKNKTKMKVYKDRGRRSITRYKTIKVFEPYDVSLVQANILTGRTHQIRVHFAHIGNPVLGDKVYFGKRKLKENIINRLAKRQMLHSWKLEFEHPINGNNMKFVSKVPKDFFRSILYLSKKRPMVVGVTGCLGSGKSKVSEILSKGIYPVWNADKIVEKLYREGEAGFEMIKRSFGIDFIDEENKCINKKKLFYTMISDPGFRQELMEIIHPLVFYHMKEFIKKHSSKNMVILEVPLLIEAGWKKDNDSLFDIVIGVFCSDIVRKHRLKEIRGWNDVQIERIDAWQLSQKEKINKCDIIIDNSFSLKELEKKVDSLNKILKKMRRQRLFKVINELSKREII